MNSMNYLTVRIIPEPSDGAGSRTSPASDYHQETLYIGEELGDSSEICRICGVVPDQPVLKIFEDECARRNISEKINKYLPIQVSKEDPLPKTICSNCFQQIISWHELVACAKVTDEKLKTKCHNNDRLINDPTGPRDTNTKGEIVPIIENYSYTTQDQHITLSTFTVNDKVGPTTTAVAAAEPPTEQENLDPPRAVIVRDGKRYAECGACGRRVRLASWRRHARSHRARRYSCDACGRAFSDAGNLARHAAALHAALRPHRCALCPRAFSRRAHLQEHARSHADARAFVCEACGAASRTRAALRMHRRTHDAAARFRCAHCAGAFKRRAHLAAHVSVHTGERAHACHCGKAFRLRSQLSRHARVHDARAAQV